MDSAQKGPEMRTVFPCHVSIMSVFFKKYQRNINHYNIFLSDNDKLTYIDDKHVPFPLGVPDNGPLAACDLR